MFYLIDYVAEIRNVRNFLRRAKLISSFFKEIHTKKFFVIVIWISRHNFKRTLYQAAIFHGIFQSDNLDNLTILEYSSGIEKSRTNYFQTLNL